ncbi:MAG: GH3 auxin-responsive promoter family protein [Chitinophagales bacterium]
MHAVNYLLKQYLALRNKRIGQMISNPHGAQQVVFKHLMNRGSLTVYGKKYKLQPATTYTYFAQQVPAAYYETLKPFIERAQQGEANVLWPGRVKWFAKSSGTTGEKSKYIPLTHEAIYGNHVLGGKDLMAVYYKRHPDSNVFNGNSLLIGGSIPDRFNGANAGDLSAVLISQLPEWLQFFRQPARPVILMQNWEQKIEEIVKDCKDRNMTCLSGVPTWMLMILKRVAEVQGKRTVAEVWPGLELFVHGGVSFTPYRRQFEELVGKPICYLEAYNASEGFFAFSDLEGEGMLLHTGAGIFYEFIPLEELDKDMPTAVPLEGVQLNRNYAIVISTTAGLWRYLPGDTVQFTSLKPYRIIITGRTKAFINVFGEEVMVHNTDRALALTCAEFNCSVRDYTVGPVFLTAGSKGAHEWLVEFERQPADLKAFAQRLDWHLQQLNSDYEAKRGGDMALETLRMQALPTGAFYKWLEANNKLGGQHKIPRLSNQRTFIEQIRAFAVTIEQP